MTTREIQRGEWTWSGIESYPQTEGMMSLQVPIDLHNAQSLYYFDTTSLLFNAYSIDKFCAPFIYPVLGYLDKVAENLWTMYDDYSDLLDACANHLGHPLGADIHRQVRAITARIAKVRAIVNTSAAFLVRNKDRLMSLLHQQIELSGARQLLLYIPWLDITRRTSLLDRLPTDVDDSVALHHRLVEQLDDFEQHMRHMNLLPLDVPSDVDLIVFAGELRLLAAAIHYFGSPLNQQGSLPDLEHLSIPNRVPIIRRLEDNVIKHNMFGCSGRGVCKEERGQFHDHD